VIAATGDKVVMEPTLDQALGSLFGTRTGTVGANAGETSSSAGADVEGDADQAEAQLAEAQKAINALKQLLANPPQ